MPNKLLLTHQEMDQRYKELNKLVPEFKSPYFYKISKGNQTLYFLGVHHTFDPKNYQIAVIKDYWEKFLKETMGKNCIVLGEGGKGDLIKNEDEAIKKHAENGLITLLAFNENIQMESPEPDASFEFNELIKKCSKEEIEYYYFARLVAQWNRLLEKPDFEEYLGSYLKRDKQNSGWTDFEFSVSNMILIHNKTHDHEFDRDNYDCFYKDSNPSFNTVSDLSSHIRDNFLLEETLKYWNEGKNIFIVYGSGHAIVLEKALNTLLI